MPISKPPKILIIGNEGQVGWELCRSLATLGKVWAAGRNTSPYTVDLSQPEMIDSLISNISPDWIINAAAYTAVDKAEEEESQATLINGNAPALLAEKAKQTGAMLVHFSTDYVYDGTKDTPYKEQDAPNPQSAYGRSKLIGDKAIQANDIPHLIFRTSWVYSSRGHNFLRTIRRLAREKEELHIISDQHGSPTWARNIADATAQILSTLGTDKDAWREKSGLYHMACSGQGSWYDFASAIIDQQASHERIMTSKVHPISTEEYPLPAKRPQNSVLSTQKLRDTFGIHMPEWHYALSLALEDINEKLI